MDPRLTPEQQIIVAKWEEERAARGKLIDQLVIAEKNGDDKAFRSLLDQMMNLTPDCCEHGRSIVGTCAACDEIERIIYPAHLQEEDE